MLANCFRQQAGSYENRFIDEFHKTSIYDRARSCADCSQASRPMP